MNWDGVSRPWPTTAMLSTVGGWVACRGAGQLSNRYGKIEDMVVGLDVALADGTTVTTGGTPRAAVGPDLTQVFVGELTLDEALERMQADVDEGIRQAGQ